MGSLQGKISGVDIQRLDELALDFAKYFLKEPTIRTRTIGLYGCGLEVLEFVKKKMDDYFKEEGEEVSIGFDREGYTIDVGRFVN